MGETVKIKGAISYSTKDKGVVKISKEQGDFLRAGTNRGLKKNPELKEAVEGLEGAMRKDFGFKESVSPKNIKSMQKKD